MFWRILFVLCGTLTAVPAKRPFHINFQHRPAEDRIINGKEADIRDFAYQISFRVTNGNQTYFCGGFIISENFIMTAAHCAVNATPKAITLRAGSSFRENGTIIPIKEVYAHPQYDNPQFDKDVGIFKTAKPIEFTDSIKAIPIAKKGFELKDGSKIIASGWGKTQYTSNTIPTRLMSVETTVVSPVHCGYVYPNMITNNMWCAGNLIFGGKGTCQGDSGGPATQDGVAVGVVSWGRFCAYPLSPSVFAKISSPDNRDFIFNVTGI